MLTNQTIGIVSAVVIGGLGYWFWMRDEEDTTTTTTTTTNGGDTTPECSDDLGCPADKPYCVDGTCTDEFPLDEYTKKSGSPYPRFGVANLWRDSEAEKTLGARAQYYGLSEAAQACSDDPTCIGFSYWPERYTVDWPKDNPADCSDDGDCVEPEEKVLWETGVCVEGKCRAITWGRSYFYTDTEAPGETPVDWAGDSWHDANGGLTLSQSVGPSHEMLTVRRPRTDGAHQYGDEVEGYHYKYEEHQKQVGYTYIKKGYEDYKPSDSWNDDGTAKTQTSDNGGQQGQQLHQNAEDEEVSQDYTPPAQPTGSGYIISDDKSSPGAEW